MADQQNKNSICSSPEMQQYFNTLPEFIQETITQSGAQISTVQDLKACADNLMKKQS